MDRKPTDMKHIRLTVLMLLSTGSSLAQDLPILGLVEQIPVRNEDMRIVAKPLYILTDRKLDAPTVFSALQRLTATIDVACCFEVIDTTPLSLRDELRRYAHNEMFAPHIKGIKGYRFLYRARPVTRERWSPTMKTTMANMASPSDTVPYSLPVIGATLTRSSIPGQYLVDGKPVTYKSAYTRNNERIVHTFTLDHRKTIFSETTVLVEGQ